MKKTSLNNIVAFFVKYIWMICIVLIILEVFSTLGTAVRLTEQSTQTIAEAVTGEISGRVDGVFRMIKGLAEDERIADLSQPLYNRAILARSYRKSYDLYMIALTDESVNVISCDVTQPPATSTSLAHRQYMQQLYATGEPQITDAFIAGADGVTMNYTIAVPIFQGETVKGSVFGAIRFQDIQDILSKERSSKGFFYLWGKEKTVMAGAVDDMLGKPFSEVVEKSLLIGTTSEEIAENLQVGKSDSLWEFTNGEVWCVNYRPVPPTQWSISYHVPLSSVFWKLLPGLLSKILIYIFMCCAIAIYGKRYINQYFAQTNHLLERMSLLQKEIFKNDSSTYDELLDLTQKGLNDHLTGLYTRTVLVERAGMLMHCDKKGGGVFLADLDDLKKVNDIFGHEAGDYAIIHFGKVLSQLAEQYNGVASRYGGDEFVLLVDGITFEQMENLAKEICANLRTTLQIKGKTISIHGSVGGCHYNKGEDGLEELICKADLALYSAKQHGKNCYSIYEDTL